MSFSLLTSIPADIWSGIFQYIDTYDQMIVWNTGCKAIQDKLGPQGGWKALKFESLPFIKKWPRSLLPCLSGLNDLCISAYEHYCLLPQLRPTLDDLIQLPQTLLKLKIDFVDALRDEHVSLLPKSLYSLSLPHNRSISLAGLSLLPSGITNLNLKRNLRISDASALPRSLVSFKGNCSAMTPSATLGQDLPPSLTLLKLENHDFESKWNMSDISVVASHPSLKHLCIRDISHHTSSSEPLQFPSTLETLILESDAYLPENSIERLPMGLKLLKMVTQHETQWDWTNESIWKLPRGLKHFEVMTSLWYKSLRWKLSSDCLEYLPRELETLKLESLPCRPTRPNNLEKLPTTLTDLRLPPNYDRYSLLSLPPNLVKFYGCNFKPEPDFLMAMNYPFARPIWDSDPYGSTISYTNSPYPGPDPETLQSNRNKFPKKWKTLSLTTHSDYSNEIHPNFCQVSFFESDCFDAFSRFCIPEWNTSLRTLNIDLPVGSRPEIIKMLPRFLTKLNISLNTTLEPLKDAHLLDLPETLTELRLRVVAIDRKDKSFALTDQCIWALPHDLVTLQIAGNVGIGFDKYPLPKRIQTLTLNEKGDAHPRIPYRPLFPFWTTHLSLLSTRVSKYTFEGGLPTYLTKLVVNEKAWLEGRRLLPVLPSTLTHLEASGLDMVDGDVQNLPRSLRTFICVNASKSLTIASSPHWPPLLLKLSIKGSRFTNDAIEPLPKSITELILTEARYIVNPGSLRSILGPHIRMWTIYKSSMYA